MKTCPQITFPTPSAPELTSNSRRNRVPRRPGGSAGGGGGSTAGQLWGPALRCPLWWGGSQPRCLSEPLGVWETQ